MKLHARNLPAGKMFRKPVLAMFAFGIATDLGKVVAVFSTFETKI
jgi:hypothetical protein